MKPPMKLTPRPIRAQSTKLLIQQSAKIDKLMRTMRIVAKKAHKILGADDVVGVDDVADELDKLDKVNKANVVNEANTTETIEANKANVID